MEKSKKPPDGLDKLYEDCYKTLQNLAHHIMRSQNPAHTLRPTALVNEAYLKLNKGMASKIEESHFLALSARAMRQVLIDHARKKKAERRGGGWEKVELDERIDGKSNVTMQINMLTLDTALKRLAESDERLAQVAELRLFGGLTSSQIAKELGVSRRTVTTDWKLAQHMLQKELA